MVLTGPWGGSWHHLLGFIGSALLLIGLTIAVAIGALVLTRLVRMDEAPQLDSLSGGDGTVATWWRRITGRPDPALAELRLRYARGEVTQEEYLIRAYDLGGHATYAPPPTPGHIGTEPSATTLVDTPATSSH
jgi:hypothetical protein